MPMPHHPFTDAVMQVALPRGFEPPRIPVYEGFSDPEDHLQTFIAHMIVHGSTATNPLFCRAFPCTLTKYALRWFFSLPPSSIENFSQLSSKFLTHFAMSKTCRKTKEFLTDMYQPVGGSLQEYISSFNRVAVQIDNIDPLVYMERMIEGLAPGTFMNSLYSDPPLTLDDMWQRAKDFLEKETLHKEKQERGIYTTPPKK